MSGENKKMANPRKGKIMHTMWLTKEEEKQIKLGQNVGSILDEVFKRGDSSINEAKKTKEKK